MRPSVPVANPDPLLSALGDALRTVREERGLSQEGLGLATGVHRNYIGGVERGERQPTVATIAKLADGLGCRTSELFVRAEALIERSGG